MRKVKNAGCQFLFCYALVFVYLYLIFFYVVYVLNFVIHVFLLEQQFLLINYYSLLWQLKITKS